MACHCPVIATDVGGIPEVIEHQKSGFLSPVGNTDDMTKNILRILESKSSLHSYKVQAGKRAQNYDIQKILPAYEKLYNDSINTLSD